MSASGARRAAERYLMNTYKRPPLVFTRGKGCYLWDDRGRRYLDFLGGIAVNALGHAHPRLVRVVRREAARAIHLSNLFHNPYQGPLAEKLVKWSKLDRVFFTNSGTEAIEGALKLARIYARKKTGADAPPVKTRVLALEHSFHGRTFGALAITASAKYREPYEPLMPGAEFVRFNDVADLEAKFDDTVCAIVLEPIQGEGGVFPVSEEFYSRARQLCTQRDAALIADEIQCGLGRTGRCFAYQKFGALPDIVVVAKPLAGGLPLGAILASEKFASAFAPGLHGTTFGGGPLVCAAALEFLTTVEREKLLVNVRARGEELRAGLEKLKAKFDFVKEVRGEGLIVGMELTIEGAAIAQEALKRGVIINCTHERTLRFLPPFIVTSKHVKEFLAALESVLASAARKIKAAPAAPARPATAAAGSAR
ncbi:MAG: acetylornithine transaminase [Acidobacteria bacterium]|nr:acetylornithine transaminase [Acidobacteriota bacterium]MBI3664302.1 acetylornithine transaminase [Acidobacteriota bacterium]